MSTGILFGHFAAVASLLMVLAVVVGVV